MSAPDAAAASPDPVVTSAWSSALRGRSDQRLPNAAPSKPRRSAFFSGRRLPRGANHVGSPFTAPEQYELFGARGAHIRR